MLAREGYVIKSRETANAGQPPEPVLAQSLHRRGPGAALRAARASLTGMRLAASALAGSPFLPWRQGPPSGLTSAVAGAFCRHIHSPGGDSSAGEAGCTSRFTQSVREEIAQSPTESPPALPAPRKRPIAHNKRHSAPLLESRMGDRPQVARRSARPLMVIQISRSKKTTIRGREVSPVITVCNMGPRSRQKESRAT